MVLMIAVTCSWFQVLTVLRVDSDETNTDGAMDLSWLLVRPALALLRLASVSGVTVWMLDARAADTCTMHNTQLCKKPMTLNSLKTTTLCLKKKNIIINLYRLLAFTNTTPYGV